MVNSSFMLAQLVVSHDLIQDTVGKTVFLWYLTKELVARIDEVNEGIASLEEMKTLKKKISDMLQQVRDSLSIVASDFAIFSFNMGHSPGLLI
jgi:mannose/fructose/N-acetylgalactosamine-specific phosphotransferase system component IIB